MFTPVSTAIADIPWSITGKGSTCSYVQFNNAIKPQTIEFGDNRLTGYSTEILTGKATFSTGFWLNVTSFNNTVNDGKATIIQNKLNSYPTVCENAQNATGVADPNGPDCTNQFAIYTNPNGSGYKLQFDITADNLSDRPTSTARAFRLESTDILKTNTWYYVNASFDKATRNMYLTVREKDPTESNAFLSTFDKTYNWKTNNPTASSKETPDGLIAKPTSGTNFSMGTNLNAKVDEVKVFNHTVTSTSATQPYIDDVSATCGLNYFYTRHVAQGLTCTGATTQKIYPVKLIPHTYLDKPYIMQNSDCVSTECLFTLKNSKAITLGSNATELNFNDQQYIDVDASSTSAFTGGTFSIYKNTDATKALPLIDPASSIAFVGNTAQFLFLEYDPVTKTLNKSSQINNQIAGKPSHQSVSTAKTAISADASLSATLKADYANLSDKNFEGGSVDLPSTAFIKEMFGTKPQSLALYLDYCSTLLSTTTAPKIIATLTATNTTTNQETCTPGTATSTTPAKNIAVSQVTSCTPFYTKTTTYVNGGNNNTALSVPATGETLTVTGYTFTNTSNYTSSSTCAGTTAGSCSTSGTTRTCTIDTTTNSKCAMTVGTPTYVFTSNGVAITSANYATNNSLSKKVWTDFSTAKVSNRSYVDVLTNTNSCDASNTNTNPTVTCSTPVYTKLINITKTFDTTNSANFVLTTDTAYNCSAPNTPPYDTGSCVLTPYVGNDTFNNDLFYNNIISGKPITVQFMGINTALSAYNYTNDSINLWLVKQSASFPTKSSNLLNSAVVTSTFKTTAPTFVGTSNIHDIYFDKNADGDIYSPLDFSLSTVGQFNLWAGTSYFNSIANYLNKNLMSSSNKFTVKPSLLRMVNDDPAKQTAGTRGGVVGDLTTCIGGAGNCQTYFTIKNPKASGVEYETDANKSPKVFIRAGDPFHTRIRAEIMPVAPYNTTNWSSIDFGATGFGKEKSPVTVGLSVNSLLSPITPDIGSKGTLGGVASNFCWGDTGMYAPKTCNTTSRVFNAPAKEFAAGTEALFSNSFTWSEIGNITVIPVIPGNSYLGSGPIPYTISDPIGRFYPHHYETETVTIKDTPSEQSDVTNVNIGSIKPKDSTGLLYQGRDIFHKTQPVQNACTGFTYARQPFSGLFKVVPKNKNGQTLQNYYGEHVLWTKDIGTCKPPTSTITADNATLCLTQAQDPDTQYDINNHFDWAVKVGVPTGSSCYPSPFRDNAGNQACPSVDRGDKPLGMGQTCSQLAPVPPATVGQYVICTQFNKPKPSKDATQKYHNAPTMQTESNIRKFSDAQAASHMVLEHSETGEEYVKVRTSSTEKITNSTTNLNTKILQPFSDRVYYYYLNIGNKGKDTLQTPLMQGYPQEEAELYPTQYQDMWVERWFAKSMSDSHRSAIFDVRDLRWNMWVQAPTENDIYLRFVKTIDEPHPAMISPATKIASGLTSPITPNTTKAYNTTNGGSRPALINRKERIKTYFGRMYIGGGFSPKDVDMPMELRTEYWDPENDFLIMSQDNCTYTESPSSRKTQRLHPMTADVNFRTDQFLSTGYEQPKNLLVAPDGVKDPTGGQTLIASGIAGTGSTQTNGYVLRAKAGVNTPTTIYTQTTTGNTTETASYLGGYQRGEMVYYPLSLFNKVVTGDSWASIQGNSVDFSPYLGSIPQFDKLKALTNRSTASPNTVPSNVLVNTSYDLPNNPMQMCVPKFDSTGSTVQTNATICDYHSNTFSEEALDPSNIATKTNTRFTKSYGNLLVSRPISKECGYFDVTVTAPYWLHFTWDYDQVKYAYAAADYPIDYRDSPHGRATFCASPSDTWNAYKNPMPSFKQIYDYQNYK